MSFIGNPIDYSYIYYEHDEEIKDLKEISRSEGAEHQWYGRQLTSYSEGDVSATFTYDADGLRGSKTVNGSKTTYFYVGDQLMYECRGDGKELYFYYDSYGNLSAIRYISSIGDYYYFVTTNKQGDVLGLYSENGNLKVSYEYDTWGNCTVKDASGNAITSSIHIGNVNPIRYRGYYYDNDLGLYYLQSRYYDSTIGRFINADGYVTTNAVEPLTYNMFAYCCNNPVMFSDPSGYDCICNTSRVRGDHVCDDQDDNYLASYSEHKKKGTTNPSNKNKHQKGQSRKQRDNRGEKGDVRRPKDRSNKRHNSIQSNYFNPFDFSAESYEVVVGVAIVVSVVVCAYTLFNAFSLMQGIKIFA